MTIATWEHHISDGVWSDQSGVRNMPNKISERDVCRQIVDCRKDVLEKLRSLGASTVRYTYRNFVDDMLTEQFISSKTTLDNKWRMLKLDKIVVEAEDRTELNIPMVYLRAGLTVPAAGKAPYTKSHTDCPSQLGEGSE